jgi:hypothetical protein
MRWHKLPRMTDAAFPPETAPRQAPIALWRFARVVLCDLHGLFGPPEHIAARGCVTRALHKQMRQWFSAAEHFVRRLLFIEAKALLEEGVLAPPTKPHARKTQRRRRIILWHPDQPEAWRVSFRCFIGSGTVALREAQGDAAGQSAAKRGVSLSLSKANASAPAFHDAWPLALRAEALLRVFNDPIPYARRLARRLRAQPDRAMPVTPPKLQRVIGGAEYWQETAALCTSPASPRPGVTDSS